MVRCGRLRERRQSDPIHEFRAEFAADPPSQPALARPARRQDDGELGRNFRIVGDHLDAAVRDIGDLAVARQAAGSKLVKAQELNIRIVDEQELLEIFEKLTPPELPR